MARLESQVKGGYYPMAPEAVAAVLARLRLPLAGECIILDPCAGLAAALLQFADERDDKDRQDWEGPPVVKPEPEPMLPEHILPEHSELTDHDRAPVATVAVEAAIMPPAPPVAQPAISSLRAQYEAYVAARKRLSPNAWINSWDDYSKRALAVAAVS